MTRALTSMQHTSLTSYAKMELKLQSLNNKLVAVAQASYPTASPTPSPTPTPKASTSSDIHIHHHGSGSGSGGLSLTDALLLQSVSRPTVVVNNISSTPSSITSRSSKSSKSDKDDDSYQSTAGALVLAGLAGPAAAYLIATDENGQVGGLNISTDIKALSDLALEINDQHLIVEITKLQKSYEEWLDAFNSRTTGKRWSKLAGSSGVLASAAGLFIGSGAIIAGGAVVAIGSICFFTYKHFSTSGLALKTEEGLFNTMVGQTNQIASDIQTLKQNAALYLPQPNWSNPIYPSGAYASSPVHTNDSLPAFPTPADYAPAAAPYVPATAPYELPVGY